MRKSKLFLLLLLVPVLAFSMSYEDEILSLKTGKERLENSYNEYLKSGVTREVDLYPLALARIETVMNLPQRDFGTAEFQDEIDVTLYLIEAANLQMTSAKNYSLVMDLRIESEDTYRRISKIQKEINELEKMVAQLREERLMREMEARLSKLQSELISVRSTAKGTIISMSDILFSTGKSDLTTDLKISLARISGILSFYSDFDIIVEGHTDNQGSKKLNDKLSLDRAKSVKSFLIDMGVAKSRMEVKGLGFSEPVASNDTKAGRAKNRRVDLVIVDKKSK